MLTLVQTTSTKDRLRMSDKPNPTRRAAEGRHRRLVRRFRQRREAWSAEAQARRDLAAVLAGHHGATMRGELMAILDGR